LGNFLIYRELDKKKKEPASLKKRLSTSSDSNMNDVSNNSRSSRSSNSSGSVAAAGGGGKIVRSRSNSTTSQTDSAAFGQNTFQRSRERQLVGSLSESFNFKQNGLIKKTMSLIVQGAPLHLVSYYHPDDVLERQLRTPSVVPELANLEISPELLSRQNFRIPPMVEPSASDDNANSSGSGSVTRYNNTFGTTLPTPTQSTPNTPLPTSPLASYHHAASISTPMKSRSSNSGSNNNLFNIHSSGLTSYMDYYNTTTTDTSTTNTANIIMPPPLPQPRDMHNMSAAISMYDNSSSSSIQIPSIIPEEPTIDHSNNNRLLQ
jgi:hypothetical protein